MRWLRRLLFLLSVAVGIKRRRTDPPPEQHDDDTLRRQLGGPAWAPLVVAGAALLAGAAFVAFVVLLIVDPNTQLLALTLGGGLALIAFAFIFSAGHVLPREEVDEPHPPVWDEQARVNAADDLVGGIEGVTRRRILAGAAGAAGAAFGGAAIALPLAGAGPGVGEMNDAPWRPGVALVDEDGAPISADAIEIGGFQTAFPKGGDQRELGSPVVVVRVDPGTLELPRGRSGWAPEGFLAFSRICTHAGCAVTLFRSPANEEFSAKPALVCPCHYSTFDVRRGAQVIFGPAGRPLPQLPLQIASDRALIAAGPLSGSVGPAWWGTERG